MQDWLTQNALWIGVASFFMLIVGLVSIPFLLGRIRADYFLHPEAPAQSGKHRHPVIRWSWFIGKNLLGVILVLAGIAMLIAPGQGVLTILIGIMLLDFPGKRSLEFWIIRRPGVLKAANWIRRKSNHPPLEVHDDETPEA